MVCMGSDIQPDDSTVIALVRSGDTAAYAQLVERYQQRLRIAIAYHCHGAELVEEYVQEAFVQAYFNLDGLTPGREFYPWLRGIAGNILHKDLRRRDTARRHADDYLRWQQLAQIETDPELEKAELQGGALHECLERLPTAARTLVHGHYLENRPLTQLAEEFSTSLGALRVRLVRIRGLLRDCLERRLGTDTP